MGGSNQGDNSELCQGDQGAMGVDRCGGKHSFSLLATDKLNNLDVRPVESTDSLRSQGGCGMDTHDASKVDRSWWQAN